MKKIETKRKILEGKVISNKMQSAVRVLVEYKKAHPKYKKVIKRRKTFFAHTDEELKEGDRVKIMESKPYSKNIRWVVIK